MLSKDSERRPLVVHLSPEAVHAPWRSESVGAMARPLDETCIWFDHANQMVFASFPGFGPAKTGQRGRSILASYPGGARASGEHKCRGIQERWVRPGRTRRLALIAASLVPGTELSLQCSNLSWRPSLPAASPSPRALFKGEAERHRRAQMKRRNQKPAAEIERVCAKRNSGSQGTASPTNFAHATDPR